MQSYQTKRRRKPGFQKGMHNNDCLPKFKSLAATAAGMLTEEQLKAEIEQAMHQSGLRVEIAMLRFVMLKLLQLSMLVTQPEEFLPYARGLGLVGYHLARMLLVERELSTDRDEFLDLLAKASAEVLSEAASPNPSGRPKLTSKPS